MVEPNQPAGPPAEQPSRRPLGVVRIMAAVLFVLAGLLMLLAALMIAFLVFLPQLSAEISPAGIPFLVVTLAYGALGAFALGTGLRRYRFWAWDGVACVLAATAMGGLLVIPSSVSGAWAIGVAMIAVAAMTLRTFCRPAVIAAFPFTSVGASVVPPPEIRVIAAWQIFGALPQLADCLNRTPSAILGIVPSGIVLVLFSVATGSMGICAGLGLYAMRRWANSLAIAAAVWTVVNISFWIALPGPPPSAPTLAFRITVGVSVLFPAGLVIWQLVKKRDRFA